MKEKFGLIGRVLKHSYSKQIHALFSDYDYNLVELEPDQLKEFVLSGRLKGFNVTIPYKKQIIEYLDWVSPLALEIGAVNTVLNHDGKLYGYNTDFDGMIYMINRAQISLEDKKVLIYGVGKAYSKLNEKFNLKEKLNIIAYSDKKFEVFFVFKKTVSLIKYIVCKSLYKRIEAEAFFKYYA